MGRHELEVTVTEHPAAWGHRRECSKLSAKDRCVCLLPTIAVWQLGCATINAFSRRWRAVSCRNERLRNLLIYRSFQPSVQFQTTSAMTPLWEAGCARA